MKHEHPKVAVITGGNGTLAQALQSRLTASGWSVQAPGREQMDVTQSDEVKAFFGGLNRVDLLINQAGVIEDGSLLNLTDRAFTRVLDVSLTGAFRCSREALLMMSKQRSGHLIQIGSFAALQGTAGQANYAAAKAGLLGLTKSIAKEYGGRNIRANCVLPGLLETRMTENLLSDEPRRRNLLEQHALRRFNTVSQAAEFIVFLDSMHAVSGQSFQLDSRVGPWT